MGNNGPGFGNYLKSISHDMPLTVGHTHILLLGLFWVIGVRVDLLGVQANLPCFMSQLLLLPFL